jgi:hypothetical protein
MTLAYRSGAAAVVAGLGLVATLGLGACELGTYEQPGLVGPSETGISVQLTALPDTVNADGVSTSRIRLVLRNENGQPKTGLSVLFTGEGDATMLPSGPESSFVGPVQEGLVMVTDSSGEAEVLIIAGFSAGTTVTVAVRPYGIDAANRFFRTVEIFLF